MRGRFWLLLSAAVLVFLGSAIAVLYALERQSTLLLYAGAGGMAVSSVLFLLSAFWRGGGRVDWRRIEAEQRLWESGPLGRSWLRIRQRLSNLWKL
jgi:hypothetical protein